MMRAHAAVFLASALLSAELMVAVGAASCTPEHSEWQARHFHATRKEKNGWTTCGTKLWMTRFNELVEPGTRVLFDIGCNKGYESALFFDLLSPHSGFSPQTAFNVHTSVGLPLTQPLCGSCQNCHEKLDKGNMYDSSKHQAVHVYCFEPSLLNFVALSTVYAHFQGKLAANNAHWHLVNSAVGNHTGLVQFPRECGSTQCSLHNTAGQPDVGAAYITSVDEYAAAEGLTHIDVLKIDTEGNDPAVLLGATEVLVTGKVGLLYFEYHHIGMWATHHLKDLVERLDTLGYVCYFEGSPTLARITGCWQDSLEFKDWSNVVCVQRKHFMYPEMEKMTFTHDQWHHDQHQPQQQAMHQEHRSRSH